MSTSDKPNSKGDDDCVHCFGVVYLNDQMKAAGRQPICVGYLKRNDVNKISKTDMELLERTTDLPQNTTVICLGRTTWSGKMYRLSKPPISTTLTFTGTVEKGQPKDASASSTSSSPVAPKTALAPQSDLMKTDAFVRRWFKVQQQQLTVMKDMLSSMTENVPIRFYRSSQRLASSCKRTAGLMAANFRKIVSGAADKNK